MKSAHTKSSDGCLLRPGRPKTAGATLYLMEELGDARLRCDQLMRYINDAVGLIEQSSHKDHFFEVAGHLIKGMPETAFLLQKALQAVALAADRLDYEELKQELRPEKVDELERVLKEVRIRPVQHRSENPMTPKQAAERLREFARIAREEGSLPLHEVATFIRELDPTRKAHEAEPVAETLEKLAGVMEQDQNPVSRRNLATLLSRMAMESEFNTLYRIASKPKLTQDFLSLGNADEVKKKFKAENPDISDADLNEIAKQWQQNKDVVKDKTALTADEGFVAHFENIRTLALNAARAANVSRWRPALLDLYYIVDEIGTVLVHLGSMDTMKSESLKREIKQVLPQAAKNIEEMSPMSLQASDPWKTATDEDDKLSRFEEGKPADPTQNMSPEDAKRWKTEHENNKDNFKAAGRDKHLEGKKGHTLCGETAHADTLVDSVKDATCYYCKQAWEKSNKSAEDKRTRFEEGKPADPTENMSPEDAKKWKTEHENNKDNFKAASSEALWKA